MKYKQLLDTNMVPEWRNQYLDYHDLDSALTRAIEDKNMKANQKGVDSYFELIKFNQKFASSFSRECSLQLDKINAFHKEKLTEMKGKFNNLHDQLDQVLSSAIYRDIQPSLASYAHINSDDSSCNANTISSVSDLFRNLRGRLGSVSDATTNAFGSSNSSFHSSNNKGLQQQQQHPSIVNLFSRRAIQGISLTLMFNEQNNISPSTLSPASAAIGCELRRNSNVNLRGGKEKMTVMARKLSESFSSSAQKLSNNLTNFQNTISNQGSFANDLNANINSKCQIPSPRQRRMRVSVGNQPTQLNLANGDDEIDLQNFQILAGATPQSKSKIVASYKKKLSNLKFAFRELYFNLVLFEQYTQLNHNGFQQILRKHDRMFASSLGRKFYEEHVQTADFYNDLPEIDRLLENVEHIYTLHFENGNRRRAIEKLQVPTNVYKPASPKLDFRVGYGFGFFSVLFLLVVLVGLLSDIGYDWRTVFRLYRSPLMLIIFLFQTGISIVIWKHYKINHVLIFELDPRNNLSFHHFIEFGSLLGIIWSISVLLFLFASKLNIKPTICPLVVVLLIVIYLFNPTQTCYHQARFWLLKRLGRIFTAPFSGRVRFADFWIADQLVSIVPLFLDLEYLFCFYTTGDVMSVSHLSSINASRCVTRNPQDLVIRTIAAALPAWFRCAQCLRRWRDENWLRLHLENAGKYWCMVMVVVLSSVSQYNKSSFEFDTKRIIWMTAAIFTSTLTAYWDIIYDFGLFHKYDKNEEVESKAIKRTVSGSSYIEGQDDHHLYSNPNKRKPKHYPFLRKELVYPVWVYYFAIIENIILRFGWIITISLTEFSGAEAGLVVSLLAPMEMFRRFVWNCIRLENEQLNNCGLFRAVRDIPMEVIAPIDESHLDKVIMMMDSRDGPSMRNRLMKRRTLRPDRSSFMVLERTDALEAITRRNVRS